MSEILELSNGSYANRWFCFKKKDGVNLRFIQDVRPANAVTVRNAGDPPKVDAFSEDFSGRQIYTAFDLLLGYNQIPLSEESRDIFGILTPYGLLRMDRLPMGWSNSVQIFQRLMYKIFMRYIPDKMGIFLDDGCIKGSTTEESEIFIPGVRKFVHDHVKDVISVLHTMREAGLTVSGKKCHFGVSREFIWGEGQNIAFHKLKELLNGGKVILPPDYSDPKRPLILTVDASSVGAGEVLQQCDSGGNRYVIRYESYTFNERERRYAHIKRELYSVKIMVKKLRIYLYGVKFNIETEAKSVLRMLNKVDLPSDVAARWVAYLQMFDFEMVHIKGTDNLPADSLSRFSTEEMCEVYTISGNMGKERGAVSNLSKSEKEVADIRRVLEEFLPSGRNEKNRELIGKSSNYFIRDGLLYRRPSVGHMPMRVLENCDSRYRVLHEVHGGFGGGHKGRESTLAKLKDR
ncbi:Enzymatic polyprotein [Smittium culicis]|uniref:Enzymatic polyprotein n=1 Tax=Smittium culicis TaxID=133412 RepID=A0A1R1Y842_9FUNG|nr:Enzymatic polyprotein [Smittium culicis]